MSVESAQPTPIETTAPSEAQVLRARSLRRFNWLAVYLPIALAAIALLVLVGLLLWSAVVGGLFNFGQTHR